MGPDFIKIRLFAVNTLILLFTLGFICLIGELAVRYTQYDNVKRATGSANLWKSYHNIFVKSFEPESTCTFPDRLVAHPYLGFVHQNFNDCTYGDVNNKGFYDKNDVPYKRDPNYFTVLVTGGSVAMHLAGGRRKFKGIWLEEYLNRDFISPNGKPFRVLQGAMGAWRMPVQNNIITMYGDVVDAVVAVDGWNEALSTSVDRALDTPDYLYLQLIKTKLSLGKNLTLEFLRIWRNFFSTTVVLQDSYLSFFIFEKTMGLLTDHEAMSLGERAVFKHFNLPNEWSKEQISAWNKQKFKTYQKLNAAQAKTLGIYYAHFLQPIRLIGKNLTSEEMFPDFVTKKSYEEVFMAGTEELKSEGLPAFSLVNVFESEKGTVYGDFIHCKFENGDSRGYSIMSARIAQILKSAWNLKPKSSSKLGELL